MPHAAIVRYTSRSQRHQRSFIAVLIVHVVNDVQRANVPHRQPVHKMVRPPLLRRNPTPSVNGAVSAQPDFQLLVNAAIDSVQQRFGKVRRARRRTASAYR